MFKSKKIILVLICAVVIIFLVLNNFILYRDLKKIQNENIEINKQKEIQEHAFSQEDKKDLDLSLQNCFGTVEGSLMFPSEKIPDGMYVCARNINTKYEYCTDKTLVDSKFIYQKGYRLEVPSGQYIIAGIYTHGIGSYKIKDSMEFKYIDPSQGCVKGDACDKDFGIFIVECAKTTANIDLMNRANADFFRRFFSKEEQLKLDNTKK